MDFELTASMMCANYGNLEKEVRDLDEGGIDSFHIDIMDGRYVPNFAIQVNRIFASLNKNRAFQTRLSDFITMQADGRKFTDGI